MQNKMVCKANTIAILKIFRICLLFYLYKHGVICIRVFKMLLQPSCLISIILHLTTTDNY